MKDEWFEGSLFDVSELDDSIKVEKVKRRLITQEKRKRQTIISFFLDYLM